MFWAFRSCMMKERKRRADTGEEAPGQWSAVTSEETFETIKRLRSKTTCQGHYSFSDPYEPPFHEEAVHRLISAHWEREEAAAAARLTLASDAETSSPYKAFLSNQICVPHKAVSSPTPDKSCPWTLLYPQADSLPSVCSPDVKSLSQDHRNPPLKAAVSTGDTTLQTQEIEFLYGGKGRQEAPRPTRAPVLLGLERQYSCPQPRSWGVNSSNIFW